MIVIDALKKAADPNVGTVESIAAANGALKFFWWVEYCAELSTQSTGVVDK